MHKKAMKAACARIELAGLLRGSSKGQSQRLEQLELIIRHARRGSESLYSQVYCYSSSL